MTRTSGVSLTSLPSPTSGISSLRTFFTSQNMPILVKSITPYGEHSFLVYAATDSAIYICEANTSRNAPAGMTNFKCRVLNEQVVGYEDVPGRYLSFLYMIAAPQTHTHSPYYECGDGVHWLQCSSCMMTLSGLAAHEYSNGVCIYCGAR